MATQFIGMKAFRQNIAGFAKTAKGKNIQFIVLRKNIPILRINPISEREATLEKLTADVAKARLEVMRELGIA